MPRESRSRRANRGVRLASSPLARGVSRGVSIRVLIVRSRTGHLGRVTPPVHHDGSREGDDRLALLVVARGFHRHDADAGPRARPTLLEDLASGVDRVSLEDGRGEPDLVPPEVGEDVLGYIRDA